MACMMSTGGQGGKVISQAMKAALDKKMYGDVVVVKSAPAGEQPKSTCSCLPAQPRFGSAIVDQFPTLLH